MNRAFVALGLAVVCASGCAEKKKAGGPPAPVVAAPVDAKIETAAQSADGVVDVAFEMATKPYVVTAVRLQYVRADGMLDPTYGKAIVDFGYHVEEPGDDPKRPIGAPVVDKPPPAPPETCPSLGYETGKLVRGTMQGVMCSERTGLEKRPTCTIAKLWQRAIADGAPANALATFELRPPDDRPLEWDVSIDDEPRNFHFAKAYVDEHCSEIDPHPLPAEAGSAADIVLQDAKPTTTTKTTGPPPVPPGDPCDEIGCFPGNLDHPCCKGKRPWKPPATPSDQNAAPTSSDIRAAVSIVRPAIMKCIDKTPDIHGKVKVKVKVKPAGTVESVTIEETPDPGLGNCVSRSMKKLSTVKTTNGVTFTMPFVF